jgi:nitroreductase
MNTLEAIRGRRSIRKFEQMPLTDEQISQILQAGTLAPSGKNRQPWHFYVVREDRRAEMLDVVQGGLATHRSAGENLGSSENSARIMGEAPVTIFIFNPFQVNDQVSRSQKENLQNVVDLQSTGAAIQNMHLAAYDLGIGALWICDIFYAYDELCEWLGETHQMVAALSLGYAAEAPLSRPRKPLAEVTTWL